jgi:type IV fimbrial biogenesis protein FimT
MSSSVLGRPLSASRKLDSLQLRLPHPVLTGNGTNPEAHRVSQVSDSNRTIRRRTAPLARKAAGFNLVELLTVMTIAGILMGMGVSSYKYVTNSNRVSTEINGLLGDMQFARSEAVRQGQPVSICPSHLGSTCDTTSTTWQNGWIVFADFNGNGNTDGPDQLLRVQAPFTSQDTLVPSDTTVVSVTFNREGFATNLPAGNASGVTFKLKTNPSIAQWERCLNIGWVGIMATQRQSTSPATCN